jgi:hypothetical protein
VHPIERLRFVARCGWAGPTELAIEAAYALAELCADEPAALLPACRRLLERNPTQAPLWWVSARMLCAGDPVEEADGCAAALAEDPTEDLLQEALGGRRWVRHGAVAEAAAAEVVVVRAEALGHGAMLVDGDDRGLLEAAAAVGTEVWALCGVGRVLPPRLWAAVVARTARSAPPSPTFASARFDAPPPPGALVELSGVRRVAGPAGVLEVAHALARCDCPEPAELVARW